MYVEIFDPKGNTEMPLTFQELLATRSLSTHLVD